MLSIYGCIMLIPIKFAEFRQALLLEPMALNFTAGIPLPCGCLAHCSEDFRFLLSEDSKLVAGRCGDSPLDSVRAIRGMLQVGEEVLFTMMTAQCDT